MPQIGGVYVPDYQMPDVPVSNRRPGYGELLSNAAGEAVDQLRYGVPYAFRKVTGNITPQQEQEYQQHLGKPGGPAPAQVSDVTSGRVGVARFIGENVIGMLPYMAGSLAGGIGGFAAGGAKGAALGAVVGGAPQFVGSNVDRAVAEQGGLSEQSAMRSLAVAPFQSALDVAGEAGIARAIPGLGHALGLAPAAKAGGFLYRTAKAVVEAGAAEAVTEAGQQVGERYAAGIPVSSADAVGEYVNAAVTAFAIGGVLGAGGGFRRVAADAKPADQVTPDDLNVKIDGVLDGSLRALPSPQMFGREPQGPQVESGSPIVQDDRPHQMAPPDFIVDSEGRTTPPGFEGEQAIATDRNQPQPSAVAPTLEDVQARIAAMAPEQPTIGAPLVLRDPTQGGTVQLPAARVDPDTGAEILFSDFLTEQKKGLRGGFVQTVEAADEMELLNKVYDQVFTEQDMRANTAKFAQRLGILDEKLQPTQLAQYIEEQRGATVPAAQAAAGAPENAVGAAPTTAQAVFDANPTAPLAQQTLDATRVGERTIQAAEDLGNTVTELRSRKAAAAREKIAQGETPTVTESVFLRQEDRMAQGLPAALSAEERAAVQAERAAPPAGTAPVEASSTAGAVGVTPPPAPAAPAARVQSAPETFSPEVEAEMTAARKAAGVERVSKANSINELKTPADVFRALAVDNSGAAVSQTEKLAQKLGLITDDDARDVTPKGRQVFLGTSEGLTATVDAAQEQGFTGKQATIFERGVRAVTGGQAAETSFDSFDDMAAHQAGQVWARNFVQNGDGTKTAAQTNAIQSRILARNPGAADKRRTVAASREVTPGQVQRKALNELVNTVDLSNVSDQEQVALRRMIAQGATREQVGQAIQKLQGGESIRMIPPRPQPRPDTGGRGQPVFKEMHNPAENTPQKAEQRAQTEAAVRAYDQRSLVRGAFDGKTITQARADKLNALLDQGKVDQVARLMKDFNADAKPRNRGKSAKVADTHNTSVGTSDLAFEQAVTGKSFLDVATYMTENAPSPFYRELMVKVRQLGQMLERQGMVFNFRVVSPNDLNVPREADDPGAKAVTHLQFHPKPAASVYVKNSEHGAESALNYQTAAHEMVHSVTMLLTAYGRNPEQYGKTGIGKATAALDDILREVQAHLDARQNSGKLLNDFEVRLIERDNNALHDIDELLAWTLTNPEMQRYMNSIQYTPKQSVFSRLVAAVRTMLGIEPRYDSALAEVLRVSEKVFGTPRAELRNLLGRNEPTQGDMRDQIAALSDNAASARNRTVEAANTATQAAARVVSGLADRLGVDAAETGVKSRQEALRWKSHMQLNRLYKDKMPGVLKHWAAAQERKAVLARIQHIGAEAYQKYEQLKTTNVKASGWVNELMALSTEFQLDPSKTWDEHEHLRDDKNAPKLRQLHVQAVDLANKMRRGDGTAMQVFNEFRALNEAQNYARMAASLHGLVAMDPELALGVADADINPVDQFMREDVAGAPAAIRDRWSDLLHKQIAATTAFVNEKKGEAARGTAHDVKAMREHLTPIELQVRAIHEAIAGMQKAPYFHLGRFGNYFGSATVRTVDGQADPAALRHIAEVLETAGFSGVQISADNANPKLVLRVEKLGQAQVLQQQLSDLAKQGWLDADSVQVGPQEQANNYGFAGSLPEHLQRVMESIQSNPQYAVDGLDAKQVAEVQTRRDEVLRMVADVWLEQQPQNSISRVLARRSTVSGYATDMARSWAYRWDVGAASLASQAAAPKFRQAYVDMQSQARSTADVTTATELSQVLRELRVRDAQDPVFEGPNVLDKLRAASQAYYLGMSPSYGVINIMQLGTTGIPELAKVHGFARSFHAVRQGAAGAFKVLGAVRREAATRGAKHLADVAITDAVLRDAGLSEADRKFLLRMTATGTIDIGSVAQEITQAAKGARDTALDTTLRYASAIGAYTETFNRLTMALAARQLHGSNADLVGYATHIINESMLAYGSENTARALGKRGVLGPLTPMVAQFSSFSVQMLEKLSAEFRDAFGQPRTGETAADTATRRKGAQRFLLGHLTATAALAGTLGLPFATVAAAAIERLVDKLGDDDEPYDATAAWRGFLADTLGTEMAEVIARGLPRAVGADVSQRVGEADILPFTKFLTDRRPWKEAWDSALSDHAGAGFRMVGNIIAGGSRIADGDVMGGLIQAAPAALKGPAEAWRLTTEGYVDTKGNRMPISKDAHSILWQLFGFTPDEKADYSEARTDQQTRRGEISRRAETLRKRIVQALVIGDRERAAELISDAQAFDQDNPSFAVVPSLSGALMRRVQAQTRSQALGTPLGVSTQDIAGQNMTRYANINYAQ